MTKPIKKNEKKKDDKKEEARLQTAEEIARAMAANMEANMADPDFGDRVADRHSKILREMGVEHRMKEIAAMIKKRQDLAKKTPLRVQSAQEIAEIMAANMAANQADPDFDGRNEELNSLCRDYAVRKSAKKLHALGIPVEKKFLEPMKCVVQGTEYLVEEKDFGGDWGSLWTLNLRDKGITDMAQIEGLQTLTDLGALLLSGNQIAEIKGLDRMPFLVYIDLTDNNITEIRGLESVDALRGIHLRNNKITALKGLGNLKGLDLLALDGSNPIWPWVEKEFGAEWIEGYPLVKDPQAAVAYCRKKVKNGKN